MGSDLSWELVDSVTRSPLLQEPRIGRGVELAEVERKLLEADDVDAIERERLLAAAYELAAFNER
jgi:hypothetical protein